MSTELAKLELQGTLAEAPFDDARADLILQSSDRVYFRVFKIILSLASPIFADMISIPSPPSQKLHDEIQVVTVSENSKALDVGLRHLYPVRAPDAVLLGDVSLLLEFARKYQVDALEKFTTRYLMDNVEHDPVGVYAIAITYGCKGIAARAAQSCLNLPFSRLQSSYATAEQYGELLKYHVACGEAASAVASERRWFSSLSHHGKFISIGHRNGCTSCSTQDFISLTLNQFLTSNGVPIQHTYCSDSDDEGLPRRRYGPLCLWNYLYRSALVLAHHPSVEAVTTDNFVLKTYDCTSCPSDTRRHMVELSRVFGKEIKKAIERVSVLLHPLFHDYNVH
ncbi:hypothetical protein BJV74DRAFT_832374 [Russula compacta]|nr:hypothetical protein BJV74DRAFT_832374 [Russula compacta]